MNPTTRALAALIGFIATAAWGAPPVILVEAGISQFEQAARAAQAQLPGAVLADVSRFTTSEQLRSAPVVVAVGQKAFALARKEARQVPLVVCLVLDVKTDTFSPLVTGVPLSTDPQETLGFISAMLPEAKRIGVLHGHDANDLVVARAREIAKAKSLTLVEASATPNDLQAVAAQLAARVDVLWLTPDPRLFTREGFTQILAVTTERKIPLVGFLDGVTNAGAFASVSAKLEDMGTRAGQLGAEILFRPANQRIPVPGPMFASGRLSINLRAAETLGIRVPQSVVARAERVVR